MLFFRKKNLLLPNLIFRLLVFDFFQVQFLSFVTRNYTIEQHKFSGHQNRDPLLVSKVEFNFQISQWNKKKLSFDPVFSNWVIFLIKKGQS